MVLSRRQWIVSLTALAVLLVVWRMSGRSRNDADLRLAAVEQRAFTQWIRCEGQLQPVNRHPVLPKLSGTIIELAADGATVEEGQLILRLDASPFQEKLDGHQRRLRQLNAEWDRDEKKALKEIRQAEDVVESRKLRLELEQLRFQELESGPSEEEELNKRVALENARSLFEARQEEFEILQELLEDGFIAEAEVRQKKLEVEEQRIQVDQADVAYRKLHRPDPVKLGEQRLKVQESQKALTSSVEKLEMLKGDLERARSRISDNIKEEQAEVKEHTREVESTRHLAPSPGVVLHGRGHWGRGIAPGRELHSGMEAMTVCDMRKMKAVVAIDEGRIGLVQVGQAARVRLLGHTRKVYEAKVVKTAEKGRDEFEEFNSATRDLTGKANRQVFDVDVELDTPEQHLRPGQRVDVEIEVCQLPEALVIPRSAVYRDGSDTAWVYVLNGEEPERREVHVLAEDLQACAVKGLKMGEQVWRVRP